MVNIKISEDRAAPSLVRYILFFVLGLIADEIYVLYQEAFHPDRTWWVLLRRENHVLISHVVHAVSVVLAVFAAVMLSLVLLRIRHRLRSRAFALVDSFIPEKAMPGSKMVAAPSPPFQCAVYGIVDGVKYRAGQAFRVGGRIFTAGHVVEGYMRLALVSGAGDAFELSVADFSSWEGDVATADYTNEMHAVLGLGAAKFSQGSVLEGSGAFASCHAFGVTSMGFLSDHPSFGFVQYSGSTAKGFSGAPYINGQTVYGMHLGGASENIGYESAYLSMLIRRGAESSEDFLLSQVRRFKKAKFQRSPYNPDEYRLIVGGRYYLVDYDVIQHLADYEEYEAPVTFEQECADREVPVEEEEEIPPPVFKVADRKGNEIRAPASAGARGQPSLRLESAPRPSSLVSRVPVTSSPQATNTVGRTLTRAQRKGASESMSQSLKTLRRVLRNLENCSEIESSEQSRINSRLSQLHLTLDNLSKITSKRSSPPV